MHPRTLSRRSRRGAVVVEFALIVPLVMLLLAGIWEIGRMINVHHLLHNACREAGRQAASGKLGVSDVQQVVLDYLDQAGISTTGMALPVIENITDSNRPDPTEAEQMDQFRVTATLPVAAFEWSPVHLFTSQTGSLTVSVDWYSMRDLELTVNEEIPDI